mgnify:CR=1 FL=1
MDYVCISECSKGGELLAMAQHGKYMYMISVRRYNPSTTPRNFKPQPLCNKVIDIRSNYGSKQNVYYNYLHMKSVVVCPRCAKTGEETLVMPTTS